MTSVMRTNGVRKSGAKIPPSLRGVGGRLDSAGELVRAMRHVIDDNEGHVVGSDTCGVEFRDVILEGLDAGALDVLNLHRHQVNVGGADVGVQQPIDKVVPRDAFERVGSAADEPLGDGGDIRARSTGNKAVDDALSETRYRLRGPQVLRDVALHHSGANLARPDQRVEGRTGGSDVKVARECRH